MRDLSEMTSAEKLAYASGLRDAHSEFEIDLDGYFSRNGVGRAGRLVRSTAKRAETEGFIPAGPIPWPERVRQSTIQSFDRCALSTLFDLDSKQTQTGYLGATGHLFHAAVAQELRLMRSEQRAQPSPESLMEILRYVVVQDGVDRDDVVHTTMQELRRLQSLCWKWARHQRQIDWWRIAAIEGDAFPGGRLDGTIQCVDPRGNVYERVVTGRPDLVLIGPGTDEAEIVDWKSGWGAPSEKRQLDDEDKPVDAVTGEPVDDEDRLSDMGYVQQVVYGWLLMKVAPAIQRVHMHEHYVQHDETRSATIERYQMEQIEDVLSIQVAKLDAAIRAGRGSSRWMAVAGAHCGYCLRPRDCPIKDEVGMPATLREAQRLAGEWFVGGQIREDRLPFLKSYVDVHGPIPIRHAKGRREVGWLIRGTASEEVMASCHNEVKCSRCKAQVGQRCIRPLKDGYDSSKPKLKNPHYERWSKVTDGVSRSFTMYEPSGAAESPLDPDLEAAARERGVLVETGVDG